MMRAFPRFEMALRIAVAACSAAAWPKETLSLNTRTSMVHIPVKGLGNDKLYRAPVSDCLKRPYEIATCLFEPRIPHRGGHSRIRTGTNIAGGHNDESETQGEKRQKVDCQRKDRLDTSPERPFYERRRRDCP